MQATPTPVPIPAPTTTTAPAPTTTNPALKRKSPGADPPLPLNFGQPQSTPALSVTDPGPQPWPNTSTPGRPTLTGGLPMGRMAGTCGSVQPLFYWNRALFV